MQQKKKLADDQVQGVGNRKSRVTGKAETHDILPCLRRVKEMP
jgi:hypothetical protein